VTGWLEALRALAAARVAASRRSWDTGGRRTLHDVIDTILAGEPAADCAPEVASARGALGTDPHWRQLARVLGVAGGELDWLAVLVACELDPRLTRVLGYLDDSANPAPPTPAVAALLWDWPPGYQPGPASALARWELAGPVDGWHRTTPWTVDADIAAFLAGEADWVRFRDAVSQPDLAGLDCLHPALLADMASAAAALTGTGRAACEVELTGQPGSGRRTLLGQLAAEIGQPPLIMTGSDQVRSLRSARLLGGCPIWIADGDAAVGTDSAPRAITLVARREPATALPPGVVRLSWALPPIRREQRELLWRSRTSERAPRMLHDWELTPADIELGAAAAVAGPAVSSAVIRRRLRAGSLESMTAVDCPYGWDDLIVPGHVADQLHRLRDQVLLTRDVLDDWEFRRLCPSSTGIAALFAGPSGTGKTMAAQVLARALELDLYRVDLAEVINKYIGETEKRLAVVFAECERSNVMVLFDEADALFGQRTRVRDAHDRYANIEIDYLLQRLDTFRGVAILATNRKNDLDPAFLRRLRVIIDFVAPAPSERLRLWRQALPASTTAGETITAGLDHRWLAANLELTGAEIKSIALAAAFEARKAGQLIGTEHVLDASRRELGKRGAVLRFELPALAATGVNGSMT
jgi:ATPase family associated with various cellular activities (AAA)